MLALAYGPPPQRGVTTLMSVGADDALYAPRIQDVLVTAGLVTWLVGLGTGMRTVERIGFWGGLGALVWKVVR